ncbi:coiled-coil domain-containing protein [Hyalangium gracile]|uniref:hypothetical protein n=1 Tax=Hyalangium gracile TaxID=394092 RepID=UPI001CC90923|nr:hypothetical protein [Hyalangium gracile]
MATLPDTELQAAFLQWFATNPVIRNSFKFAAWLSAGNYNGTAYTLAANRYADVQHVLSTHGRNTPLVAREGTSGLVWTRALQTSYVSKRLSSKTVNIPATAHRTLGLKGQASHSGLSIAEFHKNHGVVELGAIVSAAPHYRHTLPISKSDPSYDVTAHYDDLDVQAERDTVQRRYVHGHLDFDPTQQRFRILTASEEFAIFTSGGIKNDAERGRILNASEHRPTVLQRHADHLVVKEFNALKERKKDLEKAIKDLKKKIATAEAALKQGKAHKDADSKKIARMKQRQQRSEDALILVGQKLTAATASAGVARTRLEHSLRTQRQQADLHGVGREVLASSVQQQTDFRAFQTGHTHRGENVVQGEQAYQAANAAFNGMGFSNVYFHSEQWVLAALREHGPRLLKELLVAHGYQPNQGYKVYAIIVDMFSTLDCCRNCQKAIRAMSRDPAPFLDKVRAQLSREYVISTLAAPRGLRLLARVSAHMPHDDAKRPTQANEVRLEPVDLKKAFEQHLTVVTAWDESVLD